jgi:uncharacterized repeat protein (TIGR01451 family)
MNVKRPWRCFRLVTGLGVLTLLVWGSWWLSHDLSLADTVSDVTLADPIDFQLDRDTEPTNLTLYGAAAGLNPAPSTANQSQKRTPAASVSVVKTANPTTVAEFGEEVTFTVVATNTSLLEMVTINAVVDDQFGDVGATCQPALPAFLLPGAAITCSFTEFIRGDAGTTHTNVVSVSGVGLLGGPADGTSSASVEIVNVPSAIEISASANPGLITAPGSPVTFTVHVDNTSATDVVTITALTDSLQGDLNGRGSCVLPQVLAVGAGYDCEFEADVAGTAGSSEINTIAAVGVDDDNESVSDGVGVTITIIPTEISSRFLPVIAFLVPPEPILTELWVFNDNVGSDALFIVVGAEVQCTVPNGEIRFCGTFLPGIYEIRVETSTCGDGIFTKTYEGGRQNTRVYCNPNP